MDKNDQDIQSQEVGSKGDAKKGGSTFRWNSLLSKFVLKFMVEEVKMSNKPDKGFKGKTLTACANATEERFGCKVTDANVNNHLRTLKNRHALIKKLKVLSGMGWNEDKHMIVMDENEYTTHIQKYPLHEPFLNKPLEDYEEMSIICGNEQAIGFFAKSLSCNSSSIGTRMEPLPATQENMPKDVEDEPMASSEHRVDTSLLGSGSSSKVKGKKAKRLREDQVQVIEKFSMVVGRVADALETDKEQRHAKKLYDVVMSLRE